jgi:hypothetical protein
MDILMNNILPLFDQVLVKGKPQINTLISTALNEYTIYVSLLDVYNRTIQSHMIPIYQKKVEYQIPIFYHQIVLSNKGHHFNDLVIQVKTVKDDRFIRVNSHDLFVIEEIPLTTSTTYMFKHIDGEEIELSLDPKLSKFRIIEGKALPKPDHSRGNLHILLLMNSSNDHSVTNGSEISSEMLSILNYDSHSNVLI